MNEFEDELIVESPEGIDAVSEEGEALENTYLFNGEQSSIWKST